MDVDWWDIKPLYPLCVPCIIFIFGDTSDQLKLLFIRHSLEQETSSFDRRLVLVGPRPAQVVLIKIDLNLVCARQSSQKEQKPFHGF